MTHLFVGAAMRGVPSYLAYVPGPVPGFRPVTRSTPAASFSGDHICFGRRLSEPVGAAAAYGGVVLARGLSGRANNCSAAGVSGRWHIELSLLLIPEGGE